jgi:hypothetical protein
MAQAAGGQSKVNTKEQKCWEYPHNMMYKCCSDSSCPRGVGQYTMKTNDRIGCSNECAMESEMKR